MIRHLKLDVRDVSDTLKGIDIEDDDDDLEEYTLETSSLIIERVIDSFRNVADTEDENADQ